MGWRAHESFGYFRRASSRAKEQIDLPPDYSVETVTLPTRFSEAEAADMTPRQ
jgi:hypothetical protein